MNTISNFMSISIVPVALVSPFQSLSVVMSSASQPLGLDSILAASADPQSPSCWTASAQSDSHMYSTNAQTLSHQTKR